MKCRAVLDGKRCPFPASVAERTLCHIHGAMVPNSFEMILPKKES